MPIYMPPRLDLDKTDIEKALAAYIPHLKEKIALDYVKNEVIKHFTDGQIMDEETGNFRPMTDEERSDKGRDFITNSLKPSDNFNRYAKRLSELSYFRQNSSIAKKQEEYETSSEILKNIKTAIRYQLENNNDKIVDSSLDGIDFTKDVKIATLRTDEKIYTAQIGGFAIGKIRQGRFYSPDQKELNSEFFRQHADQIGAAALTGKRSAEVFEALEREYGDIAMDEIDTEFYGGDAEVLESTIAPIWDTWSSPIPIHLEGGEIQYQAMGEEKRKIKSLDRKRMETILTKIKDETRKNLSKEDIDLLVKYIRISKNRGEFAKSKGWELSLTIEIGNTKRISTAITKILETQHRDEETFKYAGLAGDLAEQTLKILDPHNPYIS